MKDKEIPNEFFNLMIIPPAISADKKLKWMEKLLLVQIGILDMANNNEGCYAQNKYLAKFINLSRGRVSQIISKLEEKEYITIEHKKRKDGSYQRLLKVNDKDRFNLLNRGLINSTYINNNTKVLLNSSKEELKSSSTTKVRPKKKKINFTPNEKEIELMDYWNSLPNVPKHKKPETKVYLQSCKFIRQLHEGKYFDHYKISTDFKDKNKITTAMTKRKFKYSRIKEHLKAMSNYYQPGYWPSNKDKLSKSLVNLFFNSHSGSSWFFMAVAKAPERLDEYTYSRPKDRMLYKEYKILYQDLLHDSKDETKLIEKFNQVYKFFEKKCEVIFKNNKNWDSYSKSPVPIMKEHVRWLSKKKNLYFGYLNTDSQTFTNFLIYLKKLKPGTWEFMNTIKARKEVKVTRNKVDEEYLHGYLK